MIDRVEYVVHNSSYQTALRPTAFHPHIHSKLLFFFLNDTATTEISPLPLHDALPISQLARLVQAPAGQLCPVGRKSQSKSPVGMPCERLHAHGGLCPLHLPQPNASIEAATG